MVIVGNGRCQPIPIRFLQQLAQSKLHIRPIQLNVVVALHEHQLIAGLGHKPGQGSEKSGMSFGNLAQFPHNFG